MDHVFVEKQENEIQTLKAFTENCFTHFNEIYINLFKYVSNQPNESDESYFTLKINEKELKIPLLIIVSLSIDKKIDMHPMKKRKEKKIDIQPRNLTRWWLVQSSKS